MGKKNENGNENMSVLNEAYDPGNPYAIGRKEYDDRYERLAKNAASWRKAAFAMLTLLAVSVAVVLWMAQTSKVIPYIVQVDRHGYQIAVQPAEAGSVTDDRIVMARIAEFVTNMRSAYADRTAMVGLLAKCYDSIASGSPAQSKLDAWFRENNPLKNENVVINVGVQSVLRASPESAVLWQAEWSEKTYDRGKLTGERFYKGMFTVDILAPTKLTEIMRNPLGIFISDFYVTEKL
jgi:type IV secretion system protein VirB5